MSACYLLISQKLEISCVDSSKYCLGYIMMMSIFVIDDHNNNGCGGGDNYDVDNGGVDGDD